MKKKISNTTKNEVLVVLRNEYLKASKKDKTRIINEIIVLTGYHRKHIIRMMKNQDFFEADYKNKNYTRIYNEAVKESLIIIWEASDRMCGKRLKASLYLYIDALERYNHLCLDATVRQLLLKISASTIDRLLSGVKNSSKRTKKRHQPKKISKKVQVRTFADWGDPKIGYMEIDFVVHCGGLMQGNYIHTLVATDICSGWTDFIPLLAREQSLVVEAITLLRKQLPFDLLGIDSDNDSAFINDSLFNYCTESKLEFTRSRPYKKNDQAWVEQKNGAIIRKYVGYDRFSGVVAGQALANLYYFLRLYINFFQPSFKLKEKKRIGAKIKKTYFKPETPTTRLLNNSNIEEKLKERLIKKQLELDPINLLYKIREHQAAISSLSSPDELQSNQKKRCLNKFLAELPKLWESGNPNPMQKNRKKTTHNWRTRSDPFKDVWPKILLQLQDEPDCTAKELFLCLQKEYPDKFKSGQLRTLQRRIKEWRQIMAKQLIYNFSENHTDNNIFAEPIAIKK